MCASRRTVFALLWHSIPSSPDFRRSRARIAPYTQAQRKFRRDLIFAAQNFQECATGENSRLRPPGAVQFRRHAICAAQNIQECYAGSIACDQPDAAQFCRHSIFTARNLHHCGTCGLPPTGPLCATGHVPDGCELSVRSRRVQSPLAQTEPQPDSAERGTRVGGAESELARRPGGRGSWAVRTASVPLRPMFGAVALLLQVAASAGARRGKTRARA